MKNSNRRMAGVFGAANVDISACAAVALAPGDSTPGHITTAAGGVGRNIAENLVRLGHASFLISALGDDLQGRFLLDHMGRVGVNAAACGVWPGARTGSYVSLNQPDGSLLAAVNDMVVLDLLGPGELARHMATSPFSLASAWVLDCNLSEASIGWLMQNHKDKPVFVDGVSSYKCLKMLPYLAAIDTLKVNRLEAAALTDLPVNDAAQAIAAAQNLCARGVANVVVSLGSSGVCWYQRSSNSSGHVSALAISIINSNGAGDALTAGLVHGALHGWPLEQATRFANACAALTMASSGANHPDLSVGKALQLAAQP